MRMRWALSSLVAILVHAAGCGLVLDTDPPDPQASLDGGALDASVEPRDGDITACTEDIQCDDGIFCNGEEKCEGGRCAPGAPPCEGIEPACATVVCAEERHACDLEPTCLPDEVCSADGICIPAPDCVDASDCPADPDADRCTGFTDCVDGRCVAIGPVACPTRGCLVSRCDPEAGECDVLLPEPALCPRAAPCARPICLADGSCAQDFDDMLCVDDGAACTHELCAPLSPRADSVGCVHVPDDAACDASALLPENTCVRGVCVGEESAVSPISGLPSGCGVTLDGDACLAGQVCTAPVGSVPLCTTARTCVRDTDCDDGNPCNGLEHCDSSICRAALLPRCPDSGCREGYCVVAEGMPPRCALRDTAECFDATAP